MKTRSWMMAATLAVSAVGVAGYKIGRARADGAPTMQPLYYSGVLDDGGRPVEGARSITVRLFDAAMGGTAVCTTISPTAQVSGGRFRVALDAACAGAVQANPDLWAEVIVDAVTFPRQKLGAVPYALEAARAAGASGALERRIAAVEASARPRQVVVGQLGTSSTTGCDSTTGQPAPAFPPITVEAQSTGIYLITATASAYSSGSGSASLRISSPNSPEFLVRPRADVNSSAPSLALSALTRLTAGRTYVFNVEFAISNGSCGGTGTTRLSVSSVAPLVATQVN